MLVADTRLADSAVLAALKGGCALLEKAEGPPALSRKLLQGVVLALEQDARTMNVFATLPEWAARPPALLPAVWALPYEERLAVALLFVEQIPIEEAADITGLPLCIMQMHSERALQKLARIIASDIHQN